MGYLSNLVNQTVSSLMIFIIFCSLWINVQNSFPKKAQFTLIYRNPDLTYDQKMRLKIGSPLYEYLRFLDNELPKDAVIAEPPQMHPWAYTGNGAFLKYFIYPRTLIQVSTPSELPSKEATHSLVVWGDSETKDVSLYGWPKMDLTDYQATYYQIEPPLGFIKLK